MFLPLLDLVNVVWAVSSGARPPFRNECRPKEQGAFKAPEQGTHRNPAYIPCAVLLFGPAPITPPSMNL
jgi:hypothetical protein